MEGKILSTVGGIYKVYSNGKTYSLFSRGAIKHKSFSLCSGDNIIFNEEENIIEKAHDRKNFLIRPRSANVDLMMITMSFLLLLRLYRIRYLRTPLIGSQEGAFISHRASTERLYMKTGLLISG